MTGCNGGNPSLRRASHRRRWYGRGTHGRRGGELAALLSGHGEVLGGPGSSSTVSAIAIAFLARATIASSVLIF